MLRAHQSRRGLLIVNLGSPDSASVGDVKSYLKQFLMDREVIDIPWMLRYPLVNWIIAPTRAPKSAHAYETIFSDLGSPLRYHSQDFTDRVRPLVSDLFSEVRLGMRYGKPSIGDAVRDMKACGIEEIFVVPMYPQFAKSSTRTALSELRRHFSRVFVNLDFFSEPEFIASFQNQILKGIETFRPDHLVLSYHGLPEHHVKEFGPEVCLKDSACCSVITEKNRFCYRAQCFTTSALILRGLPKELSHTISFQSRLGRREWIKPYTDQEIFEIVKQGKKRVLVACPAFVADCLETLEEIGLRLKADFIKAGGEDLRLVPSLNSEDHWVENFSAMIRRRDREFLPLDQAMKRVQG